MLNKINTWPHQNNLKLEKANIFSFTSYKSFARAYFLKKYPFNIKKIQTALSMFYH